jgi:hypothetical protein
MPEDLTHLQIIGVLNLILAKLALKNDILAENHIVPFSKHPPKPKEARF